MSEIFGLLKYPSSINPSPVPSPPPQLLHSTVWYPSPVPSPAPQLLHSNTVCYPSLVPSPAPQLLYSTVCYSSLVPSPAPQLLHSNTVWYSSLVPMLPLVDQPLQTLPGGRLRWLPPCHWRRMACERHRGLPPRGL